MNLLEVDPEKLREILGSSDELGLSSEQAQENLREFGPNTYSGKLPERFGFFKRIFSDVLLLLFVFMTLFVLFTSPSPDMTMTLIFTLVGYLVFSFGSNLYIEIVKNRVRATDKLRCRVKRNGKLVSIDWRNVVPGDTLYLEKGEVVPCDGIIVKKRALKVLEANVTGKCEAMIKQEYRDVSELNLPYFDCILFAGTVILNGTATLLVCNTGKNIFDGGGSGVARSQEQMPSIHHGAVFLAKQQGLLWIPVSFLIFALGIVSGLEFFETFFYSLAIMTSALPDAAGVLSELCVAIQVSALMKKGAVLKNYAAIDKLSGVNCVAVHNEDFFLGPNQTIGTYLADDCPYQFKETPGYAQELLELAVLASNSERTPFLHQGRNVDRSLAQEASAFGIRRKRLEKNQGLFNRREYDDRLGFSAVFCVKNDRYRFVIRGKSENVLRRCTHIKRGERTQFLNESAKLRLMDTARSFAVNGEFVLAVAVSDSDKAPDTDFPACIRDMVFVGFIGLCVPVRTAAAQAVAQCVKNGTDVLLVTGGENDSSFGLAKSLSMIGDGDKQYAMDERMYQRMDKGLFLADLREYKVFCGFDPGEQRDIIRYRNENGDVTATVTDSISSSVAQSEADVSFVYRKSAYSCVRHNADVLLDKLSFEGVQSSLKTAFAVCSDISVMLRYAVFIQFALAIYAVCSLLSFGKFALTVPHLLYFGLFSALSACVAIISSVPRGVHTPRNVPKKGLELRDLPSCAFNGSITAVCVCLAYSIVLYYTSRASLAQSAALLTLLFSGQFVRISLTSRGTVFKRSGEFNAMSVISVAVTLLGAVLLTWLIPAASNNTEAIPDLVTVVIALVLGSVPLWVNELTSLLKRP